MAAKVDPRIEVYWSEDGELWGSFIRAAHKPMPTRADFLASIRAMTEAVSLLDAEEQARLDDMPELATHWIVYGEMTDQGQRVSWAGAADRHAIEVYGVRFAL